MVDLPRIEFDILRALIEAHPRALSRDDLIDRALGADFDGLDRTVDAHIMKLRRKIETDLRLPASDSNVCSLLGRSGLMYVPGKSGGRATGRGRQVLAAAIRLPVPPGQAVCCRGAGSPRTGLEFRGFRLGASCGLLKE